MLFSLAIWTWMASNGFLKGDGAVSKLVRQKKPSLYRRDKQHGNRPVQKLKSIKVSVATEGSGTICCRLSSARPVQKLCAAENQWPKRDAVNTVCGVHRY
jgi:hypothetical protein